MFANANSDSTADSTLQASQSARSTSPMVLNKTRRNLFGIRLNHDQLKQDLTEMWKDQIDRQNQNWGFDFEKLKPLDRVANEPNNLMKSPVRNTRFEWTKVNTRMNPYYNETTKSSESVSYLQTTFDKQELNSTSESDYETEEEEYDDALAVPTFYKYQRREKMNQPQNRLKFIQIAPKSVEKFPSTSKQTKSTGKKQTKRTKMHRPSVRRSALTPVQKNLIITFSENRKDTLRSAAATATAPATVSATKDISAMFESTVESVDNKVLKSVEMQQTSAFKQPLKQQSLLDMLKQRKRKTSLVSEKAVAHEKLREEPLHNLRPRGTSINF